MARSRSLVPARLLIDTGAFYAQRDSADQYHATAKAGFEMLEKVETLVYSSEHILDETLTLLARRESYAYAAAAGEELFASRVLLWLDATPRNGRRPCV